MIKRVIIIPTITDRKVGFEFKDRNHRFTKRRQIHTI